MLWGWKFKADFMKEVEVGLVLKEWKSFVHIERKGQALSDGGRNVKKGTVVGEAGDMCCE